MSLGCPRILVTPNGVIEYVLAELFQDDWPCTLLNGRSYKLAINPKRGLGNSLTGA